MISCQQICKAETIVKVRIVDILVSEAWLSWLVDIHDGWGILASSLTHDLLVVACIHVHVTGFPIDCDRD